MSDDQGGVIFDRRSANRIANVVQRTERAGAPTGMAARRLAPTTDRDVVVHVYNDEGSVVPAYGLVWLGAYREASFDYTIVQPDYPGISMIAVALGEIPVGGTGTAQIAPSVCKVLCSNYDPPYPHGRMGAQAGSWYALWDALGPLTYIGTVPASEQPAGLPAGVGLVRARITGQRGDELIVAVSGAGAPFTTIRFSANFVLTLLSPGVVQVTRS